MKSEQASFPDGAVPFLEGMQSAETALLKFRAAFAFPFIADALVVDGFNFKFEDFFEARAVEAVEGPSEF